MPRLVLLLPMLLLLTGCSDPETMLRRLEPAPIRYVRENARPPLSQPAGNGPGLGSPQGIETVLADHQRRMTNLQRQALEGFDGDPAAFSDEMEMEVARTLDQLRDELPPEQRAIFDAALIDAKADADRLKLEAERKMLRVQELERQAAGGGR